MLNYLLTEFYWVGVILAGFCVLTFNVIRRYALGYHKRLWNIPLYLLSFLSWYLCLICLAGFTIWLVFSTIRWIIYSFKNEYLD